jgi:hypothetical protein
MKAKMRKMQLQAKDTKDCQQTNRSWREEKMDPLSQPSEGTRPADTWISAFQPQD